MSLWYVYNVGFYACEIVIEKNRNQSTFATTKNYSTTITQVLFPQRIFCQINNVAAEQLQMLPVTVQYVGFGNHYVFANRFLTGA